MIGYPDTRPWGDNMYTSIAGDDPTFPAFAECCKPYEAHYLAPCLLWCEVGDTSLHDMMACWKKYDFHPYAGGGAQRDPNYHHTQRDCGHRSWCCSAGRSRGWSCVVVLPPQEKECRCCCW